MKSLKFAKGLILGMCITLLSTTTIFADTGGGQSAVIQAQEEGPDSSLLEKQGKIDQYLFGQYADEIATKGFKVAYTAPVDNIVEIGITPYNEGNAEYLYGIFGRDTVRIVEGEQAVLFTTADADSAGVSSLQPEESAISDEGNDQVRDKVVGNKEAVLSTTVDDAAEAEASGIFSSTVIFAYIGAAIIILGSTIFMARRRVRQ